MVVWNTDTFPDMVVVLFRRDTYVQLGSVKIIGARCILKFAAMMFKLLTY